MDYVPAPLSANEFSPQYDFQPGDKVTVIQYGTEMAGVVHSVDMTRAYPYCVEGLVLLDGKPEWFPGRLLIHCFDVGDHVLVAPDATPAIVSKVCSGQYVGKYYVRYPNNHEGYLSGNMLRPVRTSPIASVAATPLTVGDWVTFIAPNGSRVGSKCCGQVLSTDGWLVVAELRKDVTLWALDPEQVLWIEAPTKAWDFEYSLRKAERFAGDWVTLPTPNMQAYVLEVKYGQATDLWQQRLRIYAGPHRGGEFWTPFRFTRCVPPHDAEAFIHGAPAPRLYTPQQRALTLV